MRKYEAVGLLAIGGIVTGIVLVGSECDPDQAASPGVSVVSAAPPSVRRPPEPSPSAAHVVPQPTGPRSGGDQAAQFADRVGAQVRDSSWATATEAKLGDALSGIPYLSNVEPIAVRCGANICEARGALARNVSRYNRDVAVSYLDTSGFAERLGGVNALTDEVAIDDRTGQFIVRFSRVSR